MPQLSKIKKYIIIAFVGFVGLNLVAGVINEPVVQGLGAWYYLLWSVGAIAIGFFAAFSPRKMNERNAQSFEKMYRRTGLSLFKKMAEGTRSEEQRIVSLGVGSIFLLIGSIMFIKYLLALA